MEHVPLSAFSNLIIVIIIIIIIIIISVIIIIIIYIIIIVLNQTNDTIAQCSWSNLKEYG